MLAGLTVVLGAALSATLSLTAPPAARHSVGHVPAAMAHVASGLDGRGVAEEASCDEVREARRTSMAVSGVASVAAPVAYVLERLELPSLPGEKVVCDASGCWRETPPLRATPRDDGAAHWALAHRAGQAAHPPTARAPRPAAHLLPESPPPRRHERPPRV